MGVDATGRVMVPAGAWRWLSVWGRLGAVTREGALVVRDGEGAAVHPDGRGRLTLPAWPRSACDAGVGSVLVAVRRPQGDVAVISPVDVLDALMGDLAGELA